MNIQALRYYKSLAETKNFTKAAEMNYVSQPALSKAINDLEKELGVPLVIRSTRSVDLTPSGEIFLEEATKVIHAYDHMIERVKGSEGEQTIHLHIGYMIMEQLSQLNHVFNKLNAEFSLETEYDSLTSLVRKVKSDYYDAIIVPRWALSNEKSIASYPITHSGLYVMVPDQSRLAEKPEVNLEDLKDEKFIAWNENDIPRINHIHSEECRKHGFIPQYTANAKKAGDAVMQVLSNNAVALVASTLSTINVSGIKIRKIENSSNIYGNVIAWNAKSANGNVIALEQVLQSYR
ncbi:MAG: LysR family transcriptional regulator [Bulleidia sp.]|nr:LysR family transcriptional regulator [Bulleidia sp.]